MSHKTGIYVDHSDFGGRAKWGATFGGYKVGFHPFVSRSNIHLLFRTLMAMATEHMSLELLQELAMASPRFAILSKRRLSRIDKESHRLPTSLLSKF